MSLLQYLGSYVSVFFLFTFFFLGPLYLLSLRFWHLSKATLLFFIFGIYTLLSYLKIASISPLLLPLLVYILSFLISRTFKPNKKFIAEIFTPTHLVLITYCFLLFLFRWEPAGSDPIKWSSLARLFAEYNILPGETRPLTALSNLQGAPLGIPILIRVLWLGQMAPLERITNFSECLSLLLFISFLGSGLSLFFEKKIATLGAVVGLLIFTQPQQYIAWGGTPTLVGACAGFLILEYFNPERKSQKNLIELFIYAVALAFCAYAHPIGFATSSIILLPVLFLIPSIWSFINLKKMIFLIFLTSLLCLPYFFTFKMNTSSLELAQVHSWQIEMAPHLTNPNFIFPYNFWSQISNTLWGTSTSLSIFILALIFYYRDFRRAWPTILTLLMICIFLANVSNWWLPLSFLWYPDRVLTLGIFPFTLPLCWAFEKIAKTKKMLWISLAAIVIFFLSTKQFLSRIFPHLGKSGFTLQDKEALNVISKTVEKQDCIQITMGGVGMWIAPLSFRCTLPFHGLSMSTVEEERQNKKATWRFESFKEIKGTLGPEETVVFDNGARLIKLK